MTLNSYLEELQRKFKSWAQGIQVTEMCQAAGSSRESAVFFSDIDAIASYLQRQSGVSLSPSDMSRLGLLWKGTPVTVDSGPIRFTLKPLSVPEIY